MRIFSMVSRVCTCPPRCGAGDGLSTYSGRSIPGGTVRRGEIGAAVRTLTRRVYGVGRVGRFRSMADRYYYCVKHHAVEGAEGCPAINRLGPYDSREEAERALEKVQQRNEEWDNDPNWNDDP
jgi:hypothetical protein